MLYASGKESLHEPSGPTYAGAYPGFLSLGRILAYRRSPPRIFSDLPNSSQVLICRVDCEQPLSFPNLFGARDAMIERRAVSGEVESHKKRLIC